MMRNRSSFWGPALLGALWYAASGSRQSSRYGFMRGSPYGFMRGRRRMSFGQRLLRSLFR